MSPLRPSTPRWPSAPLLSAALCSLFGLLFLCPPNGFLSASTLLCTLYGHLSPLRPYISSMALCPIYGPTSPLTLSPLYCSLSPLTCLLSLPYLFRLHHQPEYCISPIDQWKNLVKTRNKWNDTSCSAKYVLSQPLNYPDLFCICDSRSCEIPTAIIAK
jgi:hypothetical protein